MRPTGRGRRSPGTTRLVCDARSGCRANSCRRSGPDLKKAPYIPDESGSYHQRGESERHGGRRRREPDDRIATEQERETESAAGERFAADGRAAEERGSVVLRDLHENE